MTGIIILVLGIIVWGLCAFWIFAFHFAALMLVNKWWIMILPIIAFIFMVFAAICFMRKAEDTKTKARNMEISKACKEVNNDYLKDTNVTVQPGDYTGWLEVVIDPNKSKLILSNSRDNHH